MNSRCAGIERARRCEGPAPVELTGLHLYVECPIRVIDYRRHISQDFRKSCPQRRARDRIGKTRVNVVVGNVEGYPGGDELFRQGSFLEESSGFS